jgi:predicted amidophosphoribosyltransferase
VRGAFSVTSPGSFKGRSVLLIDDVFTTGSTSDECAREILKSGASRVSVFTLSRAKAI